MINLTKLLCGKARSADALRHEEGACRTASARKPMVVWNITRRCNLRCLHCHSDSGAKNYPGELTLGEMVDVVDDLADYQVPGLLFSGGEPMLHPLFFDVVGYAVARGLRVSVSTNGTRIDSHAAEWMKDLGVALVWISLDGIGDQHDLFRGRPGAFRRAVEAFRHCRGAGQKTGLRLTLSRHTAEQMPEILRFIEEEEISQVCFYHRAYSGRGADIDLLSPAETRSSLRMIADAIQRWDRDGNDRDVLTDQSADGAFFWLNTRRRDPKRAEEIWHLLSWKEGGQSAPRLEISNIDNQGNVHPDPFWQGHTLGNVKDAPFSKIWKKSRNNPILSGLRNRLPLLKGRCSKCRFLELCGGGFRVRAFQKYGDPWAEDPGCYLRDYEIADL